MTGLAENRVLFESLLHGDRPLLLINGELRESSSGREMESFDPSVAAPIARVPLADVDDVAAAVTAGREAWPAWAALDLNERAAYVRRMLDIVEAHEQELAILDSGNAGNPIRLTTGSVRHARENQIPATLHSAGQVLGVSAPSRGGLHFTLREPYGVVARLTAFNHPVSFAMTTIVPPLLMGNAVVLKVADQDPLGPLRLAGLIHKLFPPGVVNILSGDGPTTGRALVEHPDVKRVALTGSRATGMAIQRAAADVGVKHVTLELGGKNPLVVLPPVDVERAADVAVAGMNLKSQGQSCGSTSRMYIHESIYDEFIQAMKVRLDRVQIGLPLDPSSDMGCLVSQQQYERVTGFIASGLREGAELVAGGGRPSRPELAEGWFVEPTLFAASSDDLEMVREEIFGPVGVALPWADGDDLLRRVNASRYGLTASIVSDDVGRALVMARQVQAGYVWVNGSSRHQAGMPFGGQKESGVGYEESVDELESYTQVKTINVFDL